MRPYVYRTDADDPHIWRYVPAPGAPARRLDVRYSHDLALALGTYVENVCGFPAASAQVCAGGSVELNVEGHQATLWPQFSGRVLVKQGRRPDGRVLARLYAPENLGVPELAQVVLDACGTPGAGSARIDPAHVGR